MGWESWGCKVNPDHDDVSNADDFCPSCYMAEQEAALAAKDGEIARLRKALERAHNCATLRDDGTCDGCFVSDALRGKDIDG